MTRLLPRPGEVEILANLMIGPDRDVEPLPAPSGAGAGAALEDALVDALAGGPCFVSFSGGRDSSAILALAVDAARRHGLSLPVPAMMRFPAAPDTQETEWQEAVLEHLGLPRLEVLELGDELDALGDAATDVLRAHGVLWPGNAYMHRPVLDLARGHTVLTGIGGDELFGTRAPRRNPRQLAFAAVPRPLREAIWLRRHAGTGYRWLTPSGRARVLRALAAEELDCPYRWDGALRHWYASRAFAATDGTLRLIGGAQGVRVVNPFLDPRVLAELQSAGGRRGFPSRAEALRSLCGELLPSRATQRPGKASFAGAIWGPAVRAFAAEWDGAGVDARYVEVPALKREFARPSPDFRAILILHDAWLQTSRENPARSPAGGGGPPEKPGERKAGPSSLVGIDAESPTTGVVRDEQGLRGAGDT